MIFISTPRTAPEPRQEESEAIHHRQVPDIVLVLKAISEPIVTVPTHARRPVRQIHFPLWVAELSGDLAHCVLRATNPV
jgi:hypothetical protein